MTGKWWMVSAIFCIAGVGFYGITNLTHESRNELDQTPARSPPKTEELGKSPETPKPLNSIPTAIDSKTGDAPRDELRAKLRDRDYESAVSAYVDIYQTSELVESGPYRELILKHASRLIQTGELNHAIELLNPYLAIFYSDVDALVFLSRAYRNDDQNLNAIDALQRAYRHEHRIGVAQLIISQQNFVIGELVQELKDQNNHAAIVDLYLKITQVQPEISGYHIGLANAYLSEGNIPDAIRALKYVENDFAVGAQAQVMIRELQKKFE